ncbi:hypothetical protein ACWGLG_11535 [Streptomyces antimycoticus]
MLHDWDDDAAIRLLQWRFTAVRHGPGRSTSRC